MIAAHVPVRWLCTPEMVAYPFSCLSFSSRAKPFWDLAGTHVRDLLCVLASQYAC